MPKLIQQFTILFAGAVVCGSLGFAQAAAGPDGAKKIAPADGVMVFVDPLTHQVRPAEQGEVNALTSSKTAKAKTARKAAPVNRNLRGPSGAKGMLLDESSMQYMMVTKRADGSLKEECVTGAKNADRVLTTPAAAKPDSQPAKGELDVQ